MQSIWTWEEDRLEGFILALYQAKAFDIMNLIYG